MKNLENMNKKVNTNKNRMETVEMNKGMDKNVSKDVENIRIASLFEMNTQRLSNIVAVNYSHRNLVDMLDSLSEADASFGNVYSIVKDALIRKGSNRFVIGSYGIGSLDVLVTRRYFKIAGDFVGDKLAYVALFNTDSDEDRLVAYAELSIGNKIYRDNNVILDGYDVFCALLGTEDVIKKSKKLTRGFVCDNIYGNLGRVGGWKALVLSKDFRLLPGVFVDSTTSRRVYFLDDKQAYGLCTSAHNWWEPGKVRSVANLDRIAHYGQHEDQVLVNILIYNPVRYAPIYRIIALIILIKNEKSFAFYGTRYQIHHINGDHFDNDPQNLCLLSEDEHRMVHSKNVMPAVRAAIEAVGIDRLN